LSQRRSYSNSGDFNMDDLFRPEPGPGGPAPEQSAVPQQQAAPPVPGQSGGPEYWGAPPAQPAPQAAAPETQYLPPYPTADPNAGAAAPYAGQGFPAQPPAYGDPSYGDPSQGGRQPGQSYGGQGFPGQQASGQTYGGQGGYPGGQAYGGQQPGQSFGGQQFAAPGYQTQPLGYEPAESGFRPNQKLIIGGVVAGLAAAGILVAVLMSGDDEDKKAGNQPAAKASSAAPAAPGSGTAVSPEMKAQAQALSDLLGTASASRQAVVGAVIAVGKCDKLPESQAALTAAAAQRGELVQKLAALKTDQLPDGAKLTEQLQKAWQASATADAEYAAWAGDAIAGCDPATVKSNPHLKNGNDASGTATTAKTQASELWNAIAGRTGLPNKDKSEL